MNKSPKSTRNLTRTSSNNNIKSLLSRRWLVIAIALALTGLGASLTGSLFKSGIKLLETWRLELLVIFPAWIVLPLLGITGGFISGTLIKKLAPAASGSGVIPIMGYLRHRNIPMGLRVGLVKLVAGIIAIGSGFPLGPEGPAVQMGGSVAWQFAKWLKAPNAFRRVIVAAGGGAGIAAIFSAPLGGFFYTIEELLNSARPIILVLVIVTTFWADSWTDILQSMGLGNSEGGFNKLLGFQLERTYSPQVEFFPIDFIYLIALGIVTGLLAEVYSRYVITMQKQGDKFFGKKLVIRMVVSGFMLGGIYSCLPETFHKASMLQSKIALGKIDIKMAIITFIVLFICSGIAAASKAPGGLFYPMLTLGGSIGLAFGIIVEILTGHVPSTYVFAGMGGFIAGCSHTPITAMFLAFALTKDLLILKPILVATLTSFLVARIFSESSIYERQLKIEYK